MRLVTRLKFIQNTGKVILNEILIHAITCTLTGLKLTLKRSGYLWSEKIFFVNNNLILFIKNLLPWIGRISSTAFEFYFFIIFLCFFFSPLKFISLFLLLNNLFFSKDISLPIIKRDILKFSIFIKIILWKYNWRVKKSFNSQSVHN